MALAAEGPVCPRSDGAWLRVTFAGDAFAPALRAGVIEQLGADLHRHDVAVCAADASAIAPAGAPLADIALALAADTTLSLEVRDAVTDKRTARDLPLRTVPRDALALSIALAAEELLHASWIEAALVPAAPATPGSLPQSRSFGSERPTAPPPPPGARPAVPAAVRAVNAEQLARIEASETTETSAGEAAPLAGTIALVGAVDRSTGGSAAAGQTDLGGDLRFAFGGRLVVTARIGARAAPGVTSAHGTVQGREFLAGAGVDYALVPRDARWGVDIGARADAIDVQFSGTPAPGAEASSGSALGASLAGAIGGWGRLGGPWRVMAEVAAGAPLRAVTATDVGSTATGVAGLSLSAGLGIGVNLF
jgi:hypothetical protein